MAEQNSVRTEFRPNTLPEQSDNGRAEFCPNRIPSEHSVRGLDYSSGTRHFEGYAYVPKGTIGLTIIQIHGAIEGAVCGESAKPEIITNTATKHFRTRFVEASLKTNICPHHFWYVLGLLANLST
ncbi:hypothetical protein RJ639_045122 [Escallonia herrerae]|uniref:Uncharacterized protein n=1 Tax=Escallonia herrerae TaxID=1293975 RepID=A0AA88W503_9ASTE|nr:hypothetical protein RJ639_045122 [Escallonia herrerae]